jgi:hypothetical protein
MGELSVCVELAHLELIALEVSIAAHPRIGNAPALLAWPLSSRLRIRPALLARQLSALLWELSALLRELPALRPPLSIGSDRSVAHISSG